MRQKMSEQLTTSADPNSLNHLLLSIEETCLEPEREIRANFSAHSGPFGAFRWITQEQELSEEVAEAPEVQQQAKSDPSVPADSGLDMDLDVVFNGDPLMESLFWDFDALGEVHSNNFFSTTLSNAHEYSENIFNHSPELDTSFISSPEMPSSLPPLNNLAPKKAPFLVSYYRNTVISMFTPISHKKTVWHLVYAPSIMNTLVQMTMGEMPGNAPLCAFYAILATSAFVLRFSPSQGSYEYWQRKADGYATQANSYLKLALQDASAITKKVKYKDLLVALLCMHAVSVRGPFSNIS
jgi:arginine metabolism regulation protein II